MGALFFVQRYLATIASDRTSDCEEALETTVDPVLNVRAVECARVWKRLGGLTPRGALTICAGHLVEHLRSATRCLK